MRVAGASLAALLPHAGAMCLLDAVEAWDERRIVCISARHRDAGGNPLAEHGRLSPLVGIELAAQAMAAHGALVAGTRRPMSGWLARVRDCVVQCERMDGLPAPLVIEAERVGGSDRALSYQFVLRAGAEVVLSGSALVALMPDATA